MEDQKTVRSSPKELLDDANRASDHLAVQHLAFLAVCAYILIIAFGTTDLDLLVGKGIKLPVVDVEVPIVGFYALSPYLLVLVHFHLLVLLQLLSRKLYAFEGAISEPGASGCLRDQLNIFPYTHYLVGRPHPMVMLMIALIVSMTLVILPLATLCILQFTFLAYQDESITWIQRMATWLDVLVVLLLWPLILSKEAGWRGYWHQAVGLLGPPKTRNLIILLMFVGLSLLLFGPSPAAFWSGIAIYLAAPLMLLFLESMRKSRLVSANAPAPREDRDAVRRMMSSRGFRVALMVGSAVGFLVVLGMVMQLKVIALTGFLLSATLAVFWNPQAPRGSVTILTTVLLGAVIPLAFIVDGERLESLMGKLPMMQNTTQLCSHCLTEARRLDVNDLFILPKPVPQEVRSLLNRGEWRVAKEKVEGVDLSGRSLRGAQLMRTVLMNADLRGARLTGANLTQAQLQGANLSYAQLQEAQLGNAFLQTANLSGTLLEGAYLHGAQLNEATLWLAHLEGAILWEAHLEDARLSEAFLKGAALGKAVLKRAKVGGAHLHASDLSESELPTNIFDLGEGLVDIRKATFSSEDGVGGPEFLSCLLDHPQQYPTLKCEQPFHADRANEYEEFVQRVHAELANLACTSPHIARGIIQQLPVPGKDSPETFSNRRGLETVLAARLLGDTTCPGLLGLSAKEKKDLLSRTSERTRH